MNLSKDSLSRAVSTINKSRTAEGSGSPSDKFFNRPTASHIPNSMNLNLDPQELIRKRAVRQFERQQRKGRSTFRDYKVGQKVYLQNPHSKEWDAVGTIEEKRVADDGITWSYIIRSNGKLKIRNQKFIRPTSANNESDIHEASNRDPDVSDNGSVQA